MEGASSAEDFKKAEKVRIPGTAWFFLALFMIGQVVCSPIMMNFSSLMAETGAGGAGAAGTLLSYLFWGAFRMRLPTNSQIIREIYGLYL